MIPLRDRHYGTVVEIPHRRFMLVRRADRGAMWGKDDWVGFEIDGSRAGTVDTLFLDQAVWRLSDRAEPR